MLEAVFNFVFEVILYVVGKWFLRVVTLGRFKGDEGGFWVSLVGLLVLVLLGISMYVIWSKL
ncbi:hypothetical protein D9M68_389990 [compost metagenome]